MLHLEDEQASLLSITADKAAHTAMSIPYAKTRSWTRRTQSHNCHLSRGSGWRPEEEEEEKEVRQIVYSRNKYKKVHDTVEWSSGDIDKQSWQNVLPGCDELMTEFYQHFPDKARPLVDDGLALPEMV